MICPECQESGLKSKVVVGASMTTLMYFPPFYDESGRFHCHDANVTTTSYECSNGHKWSASSRASCWCGWPDSAVSTRKIEVPNG